MRRFHSEERFFHTIAAQLGATDQDHKVKARWGTNSNVPDAITQRQDSELVTVATHTFFGITRDVVTAPTSMI